MQKPLLKGKKFSRDLGLFGFYLQRLFLENRKQCQNGIANFSRVNFRKYLNKSTIDWHTCQEDCLSREQWLPIREVYSPCKKLLQTLRYQQCRLCFNMRDDAAQAGCVHDLCLDGL